MERVLRSKTVSKRAILRDFGDSPTEWLIETVLSDAFELETAPKWYDLLLAAEKAQSNGSCIDAVDIMLQAMKTGLDIGLLEEDGDLIRIPENGYQKAMDFAGIWYDPYRSSTKEETYRLSDKGAAMLGEYGLDNLAMMLAKQFVKNSEKS